MPYLRGPLETVAATCILAIVCGSALAQGGPNDDDGSYARQSTQSVDDTPSDNPIGRWLTGAKGPDRKEGAEESEETAWDGLTVEDMLKKRGPIRAMLRGLDHGLVSEPSIRKKLDEIMRRIVDAAGYEDLPVKVLVLSSPQYLAGAYQDGTIYVTVGMLLDLRYEDEIAFLLAHEFAHVLKGHHRSDWFEDLQNKTFVSAGVMASWTGGFARMTAHGGSAEARAKLFRDNSEASYEATRRILHPAWKREQEAEADRLGVYLAMKAKFEQQASLENVFIFMQKGDKQDQADNQAVMNAVSQVQEQKQEKSGNLFTNAFSFVGNSIGSAVKSVSGNDVSATYYPMPQRIAAVEAYRDELQEEKFTDFYDAKLLPWTRENPLPTDDARPLFDETTDAGRLLLNYQMTAKAEQALMENRLSDAEEQIKAATNGPTLKDAYVRYVFYSLRDMQDKQGKAAKNLAIALEGPEVSMKIYGALIERAMAEKDYELALKNVTDAQTRIGDTPGLLPLRIGLYARMGDQQEMEALLLACRYDHPDLVGECEAAAKIAGATREAGANFLEDGMKRLTSD